MQTKAMAVVGFEFYTDDPLWKLTAKHRKFHRDLLTTGAARLNAETFFLAEETEDGSYIAGLCVADTYGASVKIQAVDIYRDRLLKALKKAGIIIPATYGPNLYLAVQASSFDINDDEILELEDEV